MKRMYLIPIITFLFNVNSFAIERPSLYNFSVPYPKSISTFTTDAKLPYITNELIVTIVLDINKSGKVIKIVSEIDADTAFVNYVRQFLTGMDFEPAELENEQVSSRLPVLVQFRHRIYTPDFYFPVDNDLSIKDRDLYFKAISFNNIELPRIISFPSFFCDMKSSDVVDIYPVVILKLSLDEAGKLTDISTDFSTYPSYDMQLMSAALYAEFSPAQLNGQAFSSEAYLVISFFPLNTYPTKPWSVSDYNDMKLIEKYQVRLIPKKVGLLSKPIPKRIPADSYQHSIIKTYLGNPVSVSLMIDSTGRVSIRRISKANQAVKLGLKKIIGKAKFFPALDYHSRPKPFSGLIQFEPFNNMYIRIKYNWMDSEL